MSSKVGGIFNLDDRLTMASLDLRRQRTQVLNANIANAETPGYRSLGYDFEEQLQALAGHGEPFPMKASDGKHFRNGHTEANGTIYPDVYLRPTESVGEDGNTVDIDKEMADLAKDQILYNTTVELLNRKIGLLKYAISAGGQV